MQQFRLIPHATTPCEFIRSVAVSVARISVSEMALVYMVEGTVGRLRIPPPQAPVRAEGLWRETCFEAFLRAGRSISYTEFNYAPSGAWAAYRFEDYRRGMRPIEPMLAPGILCTPRAQSLQVYVRINIPLMTRDDQHIALATILQDTEGHISYWALAHAPGRPDFHDAVGFAAKLDPPGPA